MKLTKAQRDCLVTLSEAFRNDGWMYSPGASRATISVLRKKNLVEGEHDGGRFLRHRITPAGRAALSEQQP